MSGDTASSGGDYAYETKPELTAEFNGAQTSDGITLVFDEEAYCTDLTVTWYNGAAATAEAASRSAVNVHCVNKTVSGFTKIKITFNAANKPNRFIRLTAASFGASTAITNGDFYDLSLFEEMSIPSDTLPMNSLTFNVKATESGAAVIRAAAYLDLFHGGRRFGRFYPDKVEKITKNKYEVTCYDAVSLLERGQIFGKYFRDNTVSAVIDYIMDGTGIAYEVDGFLSASAVTLVMPEVTRREALSRILLLSNAVCLKLRTGGLWFGRLNTGTAAGTIGENALFENYDVTVNPAVTDVLMPYVKICSGSGSYPMSTHYPTSPSVQFWNNVPTENETREDKNAGKIISNTKDYVIIKLTPDCPINPDQCDFRMDFTWKSKGSAGLGEKDTDGNRSDWVYTRITNTEFYKERMDGGAYLISKEEGMDAYITPFAIYVIFRGQYITDYGNGDKLTVTDLSDFRLDSLNGSAYASILFFGSAAGSEYWRNYIADGVAGDNIVTISDMYTESVTVGGKTNAVAQELMERYYRYDKVFEGKILASDFVCGDTVELELAAGKVRGTITRLEYNLVNKPIAQAKILLYE